MADTRIDIGRLTVTRPGAGRAGQNAFAEALARALAEALADCPGGVLDGVSLQVGPEEAADPVALARRIAADVRRRVR